MLNDKLPMTIIHPLPSSLPELLGKPNRYKGGLTLLNIIVKPPFNFTVPMSSPILSPSLAWLVLDLLMLSTHLDPSFAVTGTSSGLGRSLVEEVLAAGERVVATTRRASGLASLTAAHSRSPYLC